MSYFLNLLKTLVEVGGNRWNVSGNGKNWMISLNLLHISTKCGAVTCLGMISHLSITLGHKIEYTGNINVHQDWPGPKHGNLGNLGKYFPSFIFRVLVPSLCQVLKHGK